MELPKFNETFLPHFYADLPEELLQQTTKSGDRSIENRIAWGKSYLKKGGLVHYPQRGLIQITEKGKTARRESVTLDSIQSNVITFYEPGWQGQVLQTSIF